MIFLVNTDGVNGNAWVFQKLHIIIAGSYELAGLFSDIAAKRVNYYAAKKIDIQINQIQQIKDSLPLLFVDHPSFIPVEKRIIKTNAV
jgi:hypothetical protein